MFGSSIWFYICVLKLFSLIENKFFMRCYLNWLINKILVYVLQKFEIFIFVTSSFDLWMSKGAHDTFSFVIVFLGFH
jgi:hypothetical protein